MLYVLCLQCLCLCGRTKSTNCHQSNPAIIMSMITFSTTLLILTMVTTQIRGQGQITERVYSRLINIPSSLTHQIGTPYLRKKYVPVFLLNNSVEPWPTFNNSLALNVTHGVNDCSIVSLTFIQLLPCLVKRRSRSLAVYNNEFMG